MDGIMRDDQYRFLSIHKQIPARLNAEQAGWVLGFNQHDVPVLVSAGLLKPLGRPSVTGSKYFAAVELEELRKDTRWLGKASDVIVKFWRSKNATRRDRKSNVSQVIGQPNGGQ